jgi:uroporphyrin-III C-methyltransferase
VTGRVVLIGGGPGAEDLITLRGLTRLLSADVVVHDRLAPTELLARLGPDVEIVDASRGPASRTMSYDELITLMVDRARAGRSVIRLQGGDPYVLAHGAQEVRSLTEAGIEVEVVPGVTSATAAPVLAGVPLTGVEAGGAAGFTVVSGHLAPDDPASPLDWDALARTGTTLIVLMGMKHLPLIAARLICAGVPADTPSACIADAALPSQRTVRAPLHALTDQVADAGLANPAVIVIGAAPQVRQGSGRRVLVLGGNRSGKSGYAEARAASVPPVTYVATSAGDPDDLEWTDRVERHRKRRPADWTTVETTDLAAALTGYGTLLIDSVTAWLTGAMDAAGCWADPPEPDADTWLAAATEELVAAWAASTATVIAVSDEIGSGVVPIAASGRRFRDALGDLNQRLAAAADEVWLVTAGIPKRLK